MRLKTRVITSVVGLCVLALVLCFFNTLVFNAALVAVVLIAFHEIYNAFALKCPAVYVGLIPVTLLLFLYGETAVRQPLFWGQLQPGAANAEAMRIPSFQLPWGRLRSSARHLAQIYTPC